MRVVVDFLIMAMLLIVANPGTGAAHLMPCREGAKMAAHLASQYKEHLIGFGIGAGIEYELYASDEGSWTFVLKRPDGLSCVLAAGLDWSDKKGLPI